MTINHNPGNYLKVESGVEVYYEDRGTGVPIIFIPGWTFTTEVFEHQMEHFSKTHRAIAIDPRSHGRSTVTLHGNNYATQGADLVEIIKTLGLKDIILVGWSFGCIALCEYIKLEGIKNVKAAICIDQPLKPLSINEDDNWNEMSLNDMGEVYNTNLQSPKGHREFVAYYLTNFMIQRELSKEELFWAVEQSLKTPPYIAAVLFASGFLSNNLAEGKLMNDSIPVFNVIAEHWSETAVSFTKKHFPKNKIEVLGGHMMFWEHPDKFNKLVGEFIDLL